MSKSILLVEDNDDDVFAFRRSVKKMGVTDTLHVVNDGRKAVEFLSAVASGSDPVRFPRPELVFLDLKLPYQGGLEILEWLRGESELVELPVVVLSGSNEARDRERASALGAQSYLVKPASIEDLRQVWPHG